MTVWREPSEHRAPHPDFLQTARLSGTAFQQADWPLLQALWRSPEVAAWLTRDGQPVIDDSKAQRIAENFAQSWQSCGVGPYLWRLDGEAIGYAGLRRSPLNTAPGWEALWAMLPCYQNHGYATEAMQAVLEAFASAPTDTIWAWTLEKNQASKRVMHKLGFEFSHTTLWAALPHWVFRYSRQNPCNGAKDHERSTL